MPIEAGGNLLKKYGVGLFLSLVVLLLLFIVNAQIYRHVMLLNTPIILLSLHVIVYKHLMPEKRYGAYFLFVLVVGASFFFRCQNTPISKPKRISWTPMAKT